MTVAPLPGDQKSGATFVGGLAGRPETRLDWRTTVAICEFTALTRTWLGNTSDSHPGMRRALAWRWESPPGRGTLPLKPPKAATGRRPEVKSKIKTLTIILAGQAQHIRNVVQAVTTAQVVGRAVHAKMPPRQLPN